MSLTSVEFSLFNYKHFQNLNPCSLPNQCFHTSEFSFNRSIKPNPSPSDPKMSRYSGNFKNPISLSVILLLIVQAMATTKNVINSGRNAIIKNLELPAIPDNYVNQTSQFRANSVRCKEVLTQASEDRNKIEAQFVNETGKVGLYPFTGYIIRFPEFEGQADPETIANYLSTNQTISDIKAAIGFPMKEYRILSTGIGAGTCTGEKTSTGWTNWVFIIITLGCQKVTTDQIDQAVPNTNKELSVVLA